MSRSPKAFVPPENLPSDPEAYPKSITKEEINALALHRYRGEYVLVSDDVALERAVSALEQERLLGFDTESRPAFHKGESYPISLVQLAGQERVYLFQLASLNDVSPLRRILSAPNILKAGVAIHDDIRKLRDLWHFEQGGFVEIADITRPLNINNTGLRSLTAIFLGFRISKNAQVSNWSRKDLSRAQLIYAATDAWVSRELYLRLEALGLCSEPAEASK